MESNNDIDKLFKEKLANREFELKDSFLADLESKLDAQKSPKKRWFFWGGISSLLLVGIFFLFYFFKDGSKAELTATQNLVAEKTFTSNKLDKTTELEENNEGVVQQKQIISGNSNYSEDSAFEKEDVGEKEITTGALENSTTNSDENKVSSEKDQKNAAKNTKELSKSTTENTEGKNLRSNDEIVADSAPNKSGQSDKVNNRIDSVQKEDEIESEKQGENSKSAAEITTKEQPTSEEGVNSDSDVTEQSSTSVEDTNGDTLLLNKEKASEISNDSTLIAATVISQEMDSLQMLEEDSLLEMSLDSLQNSLVEEQDSAAFSEDTTIQILPLLQPKKWTVSIFGGASMIDKKITANGMDEYLAQRNAEEAGITSIAYGAGVSYSLNQNINLSSGINSQTFGENINYKGMNTVSSYDSSYVSYTYTPFQDSNGVWDTLVTSTTIDTTLYDTTSFDFTGKNRFQYLQIPLMVGYKFVFNKLTVNVRLGGSYGFLIKNKGEYASPTLDGVQPAEVKKRMINLVASTTISYQLKKFSLYLEPKYLWNSSSIITSPDVKQKYSSLGCNVGVSLDF